MERLLLKSIRIIPNTKEIFQYQFNFPIEIFDPVSDYFPIILHLFDVVRRNRSYTINNYHQCYKNKNGVSILEQIQRSLTRINLSQAISPPIWTQHKDPPIRQSLERG